MVSKMKPKVAIIVPTLNVMPHIKFMIEALYNSTWFPFRLIVVDGFSTDGTFEYLKEVQKEHKNMEVNQIPSKGIANAINYGIEQAGDLDVYLTQADVIHFRLYGRDWLLEMWEHVQKENIGAVIGIAGGGRSGPTFIDKMFFAGTWNTYLSRETINKVGLFDEQFSGGDDIDYSYRIGLAKIELICINYWVNHHQLTERGAYNEVAHQGEMGKLFRKKWDIK